MAKFSAEKPKGDGWGIDDIVQEITAEVIAGKKSRLVPIVGVIDVKKVEIDPESGNHIAVVRIRRIESLTSIDRIRGAQKMLLEQVAERRGEGTILPFEEKDIIERAFAGQVGETVGQTLQDDEEKAIDAETDDDGRLRRHLVAVHDFDSNIITDDETTTADVERAHENEHAKDPADRTWPDHDPESRVWRRVDLADVIGDAEEPEGLTETDQDGVAEQAASDAPDQEEPDDRHADELIPEFKEGEEE